MKSYLNSLGVQPKDLRRTNGEDNRYKLLTLPDLQREITAALLADYRGQQLIVDEVTVRFGLAAGHVQDRFEDEVRLIARERNWVYLGPKEIAEAIWKFAELGYENSPFVLTATLLSRHLPKKPNATRVFTERLVPLRLCVSSRRDAHPSRKRADHSLHVDRLDGAKLGNMGAKQEPFRSPTQTRRRGGWRPRRQSGRFARGCGQPFGRALPTVLEPGPIATFGRRGTFPSPTAASSPIFGPMARLVTQDDALPKWWPAAHGACGWVGWLADLGQVAAAIPDGAAPTTPANTCIMRAR